MNKYSVNDKVINALIECHRKAKEQFYSNREREKLIEEITERVLAKISVTYDTAKAIQ